MSLRLLIRFHSPLLPPASTHQALQLNQYIISVPPESAKFISDLAIRIYSQFGLEEESPHGIQLALGIDQPANSFSLSTPHPAKGPTSNAAASIPSPTFALLPPSEPISLLSDLSVVHVFQREQAAASTTPLSTPAKQKQSHAQIASITPNASISKKDRKRQRSPVRSADAIPATQSTVASEIPASSSKKKKKKQKTTESAAEATPPVQSSVTPSKPASATASSAVAVSSSTKGSKSSDEPEELPIGKPKKKTRRGKKKKKNTQNAVQNPQAAPTVTVTPSLAREAEIDVSSSSSSSPSSSSASESDSDSDMPDRISNRPSIASKLASPSPSASSFSNLTRLPKGHFKFSADDDTSEPVPAAAAKPTPTKVTPSSASAKSPSGQQEQQPNGLTPAQNAAPLFFISSKEHMPREKQKRAAREREHHPPQHRKSMTPSRPESTQSIATPTTTPVQTEESKANEPTAAPEFEFRSTKDKAAIPFNYACLEESKNSSHLEADDEVDEEAQEDGIDEAQRVALAMESFGEHFIAPRTLKRLAQRNGNDSSSPSASVSVTSQFDKCPVVNLSEVTLQANDVIVYRCMELGPEWSPILSDFRRLRLEGAAHSAARQCLQGRLMEAEMASDAEVVEIPISDIVEVRLVEGPSFTHVLNAHREELRAKKKQQKWQARHQVSVAENMALALPISPKVILSPKEALAAAVATPPHLRVIEMNRSRVAQGLAPLPLPPRTTNTGSAAIAAPTHSAPSAVQSHQNHQQPPRRTTVPTTRYTLMSNVLRALQQKKQQSTDDATSSPRSSKQVSVAGGYKGKGSKSKGNQLIASVEPSSNNKNATLPQPFIIPPSSYHLPSRIVPNTHASSASDDCPPPPSVGLTPSSPQFVPMETHTSVPANSEPSLSDIDRLIQQKKQQLLQQLDVPDAVTL